MTVRDPSSQPKGGWWIHKKTSNRYEIITFALIEATLEPSVVYRSEKGQVWIRPAEEFFDGRFQQENYSVEPIPENVYYMGDNFYSVFGNKGMGEEFFKQWISRRSEFPQGGDHNIY